jgi:hypothetical protein
LEDDFSGEAHNGNKEIERFANVRNNLVLSVLSNCPSESAGQLSNYSEKKLMTKYYSQNRPDNPGKPTEPDDPDKPVDPRPFDPDPSPGDPIVDPADEPLLCGRKHALPLNEGPREFRSPRIRKLAFGKLLAVDIQVGLIVSLSYRS